MNSKTLSHESDPTHQQARSVAEEGIKINGMQQVVDLLKNADPAFRESLLRRLTQRDPQLAQNLRKIFR